MLPNLFSIGPFTFHTYGLMIVIGFILGTWVASRRAKKLGIESGFIVDLCFYLLLSGMIGSKVLYIVMEPSHFLEDLQNVHGIKDLLGVVGGGFVFYGGLLFAFPIGVYLIRKKGLPLWQVIDVLTPSIALAHSFGRLGCLAAGCCHGKECHYWFAITFTHPDSLAPQGIPLYPTQLISALNAFVLFLILSVILKHKSYDGQVFGWYIALYAPTRFLIEFLRGDPRPYYFNNALSVSQLIGIIAFIAAIGVLIVRRRSKVKL